MYEICLYYLCSSIYFIKLTYYNFNLGTFFSSIYKTIKKMSPTQLIAKLIELRCISVYLNDYVHSKNNQHKLLQDNITNKHSNKNIHRNDIQTHIIHDELNNTQNYEHAQDISVDKNINNHNYSYHIALNNNSTCRDSLFNNPLMILYDKKIFNEFNFYINEIDSTYITFHEKCNEFLNIYKEIKESELWPIEKTKKRKNKNKIIIYHMDRENIYSYCKNILNEFNIMPYIYDRSFSSIILFIFTFIKYKR